MSCRLLVRLEQRQFLSAALGRLQYIWRVTGSSFHAQQVLSVVAKPDAAASSMRLWLAARMRYLLGFPISFEK